MQNLKATLIRKSERHHPKLSAKKMTDQSYKKSCDINNIVNQFTKTGRLPENTKVPTYGDFSETPTLEAAFDVAHAARDAFQQLPSAFRKLIDNDPSQLENFIADETNNDLCYKYGLKVKPEPKPAEPISTETNSKTSTTGESNVTTS